MTLFFFFFFVFFAISNCEIACTAAHPYFVFISVPFRFFNPLG